ncbi:MAG: hypothetical protein Q9173_005098 [Seirophora scorigena]
MLPLHDPEKIMDPSLAKETGTETSPRDKSVDLPRLESSSRSSKETSSQPSRKNTLEVPHPETSASRPSSERPEASKPSQTLLHRGQLYFNAEVSTAHADILFLCCCFISGLVDSTIYHAFGTFVSMQTGNTIFLGLGGATPHNTSKPYGWAKSLVSIACFCLGCLTFSHVTRFFGKLRRGTLAVSFLSQTLIIFITAAIVQGGSVNGSLDTITDDIDWWTVLPVALLSFQSAGQIVGSRAVNLSELPTVVLTSMLHDIFTDEKLLAKANVKRTRRVLAFFAILIGAIAGGFIDEGSRRMQLPLWIAGGIKLGITLAWVVWPEKQTSAV